MLKRLSKCSSYLYPKIQPSTLNPTSELQQKTGYSNSSETISSNKPSKQIPISYSNQAEIVAFENQMIRHYQYLTKINMFGYAVDYRNSSFTRRYRPYEQKQRVDKKQISEYQQKYQQKQRMVQKRVYNDQTIPSQLLIYYGIKIPQNNSYHRLRNVFNNNGSSASQLSKHVSKSQQIKWPLNRLINQINKLSSQFIEQNLNDLNFDNFYDNPHRQKMETQIIIYKVQKIFKSNQFQQCVKQYRSSFFLSDEAEGNSNSNSNQRIKLKKFQIVSNILTKIKMDGINIYNMTGFRILADICKQIQKFVPQYTEILMQLIKKCQKKLNPTGQTKQKIEQQGKFFNTNANKTSLAQNKQSIICLTVPEISSLVCSLQIIPEQYHQMIKQQFLLLLPQISLRTIAIFMAESVCYHRTLKKEFLSHFHQEVAHIHLNYSMRYILLLFIKQYMHKAYQPMIRTFHQENKGLPLTGIYSYQQLYKFCKQFELQLQISKKSINKIWLYISSRRADAIDRNFDKSIPFNVLLKILARLSKFNLSINKLGNTVKNIKQITLDVRQLAEAKQIVLFILKTMNPVYIYAVYQKIHSEFSSSVLQFCKKMVRQILKYQPEFILHCSDFFSNNNQFNSISSNVSNIIQAICQKTNFDTNTIHSILFDKQTQNKTEDNFMKIINFISINMHNLNKNKIQSFIDTIYSILIDLKDEDVNVIEFEGWKFLYQICYIIYKCQNESNIKQSEYEEYTLVLASSTPTSQKIKKIFKKYHLNYLTAHQDKINKNQTIAKPKRYEQFILRTTSLVMASQDLNLNKLLINFINNHFIYTVKSVMKHGIFDILKILQNINYQEINPQIFAFLYSNLSSFVVYDHNSKGFYLRKSKNNELSPIFFAVLKSALKKWEILAKVENKDKLNMLAILANIYFYKKKIHQQDIARLLMIIEYPTLMNHEIRIIFEYIIFKNIQDIKGLDLNVLSRFKFQNRSLAELLYKIQNPSSTNANKPQLKLQKLSNQLTQQQLNNLFKSTQLYEMALQMKQFTNEHLVPPPATSDVKTKTIYACLRIVNKIRNKKNFSLPQKIRNLKQRLNSQNKNAPQSTGKSRFPSKQQTVDLEEQNKYIRDNNLININSLNEFKLLNSEAKGHYQMIQSCLFDNEIQNFLQLNNFNTFWEADSNPYQKVLLVLNQNLGFIKQLTLKQLINHQILSSEVFQKAQIYYKGSIAEVQFPDEQQIHIIFSNQQNFKLHMIFCYVLQKVGYNIFQIQNKEDPAEVNIKMQQYLRLLNQQKQQKQQNKQEKEVTQQKKSTITIMPDLEN